HLHYFLLTAAYFVKPFPFYEQRKVTQATLIGSNQSNEDIKSYILKFDLRVLLFY
ncbi:MAG: hypothetical protein ACI8RD_009294, partial [Bacillariaceae sp.]